MNSVRATRSVVTPGAIEVSGVSVNYSRRGHEHVALDEVNLFIGAGEFVALLGPSGCGKTTLLHTIAGIVKPTRGQVALSGKVIREPSEHTGIVFQQHSLFPWMTALENVAFGPRRLGNKNALEIARRGLASVGLSDFSDAYPTQLSGGMRQRVGIARALAIDPPVLLMDEPFGALDALTREAMQELLLKIWNERNTTVVFVTHDVEEAVFLSDRIVLMDTAPSRVRAEFIVDIPRPRTVETRQLPRFTELRSEIGRMIRERSDRDITRIESSAAVANAAQILTSAERTRAANPSLQPALAASGGHS